MPIITDFPVINKNTFNINGEIKEYLVGGNSDINAGDFVQFINEHGFIKVIPATNNYNAEAIAITKGVVGDFIKVKIKTDEIIANSHESRILNQTIKEYNAGENINAGEFVKIEDTVIRIDDEFTLGPEYTEELSQFKANATVKLNNGNILHIYKDTHNNNYGTAQIISMSDEETNIILYDRFIFNSNPLTTIYKTFLINNDYVVVTYKLLVGSTYHWRMCLLHINDSTISTVTDLDVTNTSLQLQYIYDIKPINNNQFIVLYGGAPVNNSSGLTAVIMSLTYDYNHISIGTPYIIKQYDTDVRDVGAMHIFLLENHRLLLIYSFNIIEHSRGTPCATILSVDSNINVLYECELNNLYVDNIIAISLDIDKIFVLYKESGNFYNQTLHINNDNVNASNLTKLALPDNHYPIKTAVALDDQTVIISYTVRHNNVYLSLVNVGEDMSITVSNYIIHNEIITNSTSSDFIYIIKLDNTRVCIIFANQDGIRATMLNVNNNNINIIGTHIIDDLKVSDSNGFSDAYLGSSVILSLEYNKIFLVYADTNMRLIDVGNNIYEPRLYRILSPFDTISGVALDTGDKDENIRINTL